MKYLSLNLILVSTCQKDISRCDKCEKYKFAKSNGNLSKNLEEEYLAHIELKEAMRTEHNKDKDSQTPILYFDLENVNPS